MAQRAAHIRLEESLNILLARVEQLELRVAELESAQEFELIREVPNAVGQGEKFSKRK